MGCASSRYNNNGLLFPIKARPAFLHRLEEIKTRRNSQKLANNTTFSKKELLLHDKEDDDINNVHSSAGGQEPCTRRHSFSPGDEIESCVKSEGSENVIKEFPEKVGDPAAGNDTANNIVDKKSDKVIQSEHKSCELRDKGSKFIENSATCDDSEIDEEDCLDERKLRRKDKDLGFPGSPSFRVYFNNNNPGDSSHKDLEDYPQDIAKVDDPVSQEVESVPPQEKKQKRRRSFKKVLPRGGQAAMKNLLNVRSCMSSSHNSTHDHTHLLTPKTPA